MKTWEMIKKLTDNPKLKFFRVSDNIKFATSNKVEEGEITGHYVSSVHSPSYGCVLLEDDWKLFQEPVDFMTAINSEKLIKPVMSTMEFDTPRFWIPYIDIESINGKWFIKG